MLVHMACKTHDNLVQAWVSLPVADCAEMASIQAPEPPPAGRNREGRLWKEALLKAAESLLSLLPLLTDLTAEMLAGGMLA